MMLWIQRGSLSVCLVAVLITGACRSVEPPTTAAAAFDPSRLRIEVGAYRLGLDHESYWARRSEDARPLPVLTERKPAMTIGAASEGALRVEGVEYRDAAGPSKECVFWDGGRRFDRYFHHEADPNLGRDLSVEFDLRPSLPRRARVESAVRFVQDVEIEITNSSAGFGAPIHADVLESLEVECRADPTDSGAVELQFEVMLRSLDRPMRPEHFQLGGGFSASVDRPVLVRRNIASAVLIEPGRAFAYVWREADGSATALMIRVGETMAKW